MLYFLKVLYHTQINSSKACPPRNSLTKVNSDQVSSEEVSSTEFGSEEVGFSEKGSTKVSFPLQLHFIEETYP
jgi:hypothetical protein